MKNEVDENENWMMHGVSGSTETGIGEHRKLGRHWRPSGGMGSVLGKKRAQATAFRIEMLVHRRDQRLGVTCDLPLDVGSEGRSIGVGK